MKKNLAAGMAIAVFAVLLALGPVSAGGAPDKASGDGKAAATSGESKAAEAPKNETKTDGAKVFAAKGCIACHGKEAAGVKGMAPTLKDSKFVKTAKDEEVSAVIRNGRSGAKKQYKEFASAMPANKLTDDELAAVVKYLKGLASKDKDKAPDTGKKTRKKVIEGC